MLKNYFKVAWRHLSKQKMYAFIKIGGFALGIAACLLISLYIRDELSYDRHFPNGDRIYRIIGISGYTGEVEKGVHFPAPMAAALERDFPEVEIAGRVNATSLFGAGSNQVRRSDQADNTYEEGFVFVDPSLLHMLQLPFRYGNPAQALDAPNAIVLSKRMADKYFPHQDPVGKTLILNNDISTPYRIGGVLADPPGNSHFAYDFLITLKGKEFWPGEQTQWAVTNYHTYVQLRPGTDVARLETRMSDIVKNYILPSLKEINILSAEEYAKHFRFKLQPIGDIHLRSAGIHDRLTHGDIRLVWLFGAIALFILLIACINFINLSTAKSANRALEVGLRKAIGAGQGSLVRQFLTESLLYSFFSFMLGAVLAWALLPYFNQLAGKSLAFPWAEWWLIPLLAVTAFVMGIMAGLYPSFYLSAFRPIQVLKGNLSRRAHAGMRNVLVVFQFTTSIVLIIGTLVIYRQMGYILHTKLGFDKEQVLLIEGANTLEKSVPAFKKALLQLPGVQYASVGDYLPVSATKRNGNSFWKDGRQAVDNPVFGQIWRVDHDYIKTMSMRIVQGRDFNLQLPTDSQAVIINQTMARQLGLKNPVGARIANIATSWAVIGVVEDFHFESLKEPITPLCLVIGDSPSIISIKTSTADMPGLIRAVTALWKEFAPHQSIRYTFLDDSYASMYADVQRTGRICTSFACLAVIVACLGLLGLSAFTAEQRTKEIGIRKVLGASVQHVVLLLSKDFLRLVLIAIILATPLAWYGASKWLENFAYHINLEWWLFIVAGLVAILVALFTVSFQSVKAALMNPVRSLKSE